MPTKPVCAPCQQFFRVVKNGYTFIEAMPTQNKAPSGTKAPELWKPYKLWSGDKWRCNGCGTEIVLSGREPIAIHHEKDFKETVEGLAPELQVNDC